MRRSLQLVFVLAVLAATSFGGEIAHLRNGFNLRFDRREMVGNMTRLYSAGGFVDVPTDEIVEFETEAAPVSDATPDAASTKTIQDHVADASKSSGLDADFLNSVIHHESGFNPTAVSKKGARGLMQLMPETADKLGVQDSFDAAQNLQGGSAYLRELLELYHGDVQKALAAYNAGPHRVDQYNGVPPYPETQAYVAAIIREYNQKKLAERKTANKKPASAKKSAPSKPSAQAAK